MSHGSVNPCGKPCREDPPHAAPAQGGWLNAEFPDPPGKTVGGNRMRNPSGKPGNSLFAVKKNTPILDGMGNFRGYVGFSRVELPGGRSSKPYMRSIKINWGQFKRMPRFDVARLDPDKDDPARPAPGPVQRAACDPEAPGEEYVYAWNVSARIPKAIRSASIGQQANISGWVPLSHVIGARAKPTDKKRLRQIRAALDCARHCMQRHYDARAKLDPIDGGLHEMVRRSKKQLEKTYGEGFRTLRVARAGEGNKAVRDYLPRTSSPRAKDRYVNMCWCLPGNGGVSTDTVPVGTRFHAVRKKKAWVPLYARKKPHAVVSRRLRWVFGYILHPVGDGKRARRYGWVATPALRKIDP